MAKTTMNVSMLVAGGKSYENLGQFDDLHIDGLLRAEVMEDSAHLQSVWFSIAGTDFYATRRRLKSNWGDWTLSENPVAPYEGEDGA